MSTTTKGGIILPEQSMPAGYAKFTDRQGKPCAVAVAFIVDVGDNNHGDTYIVTTTGEPLMVREGFDTVIERIKEAQQG